MGYEESTKKALLGTLLRTLQGTLLGPFLSSLWDPRSLLTSLLARPNVPSVLAGERFKPVKRFNADPFLAASQEARARCKGPLRRVHGR